MVGGLVEDYKIGFAENHAGECHSLGLSARKIVGRCRYVVQIQLAEQLLHFILVVPCRCCIHAVYGLVEPVVVAREQGGFIFGDCVTHRVVAEQACVHDR